jgi:hypothetical protein
VRQKFGVGLARSNTANPGYRINPACADRPHYRIRVELAQATCSCFVHIDNTYVNIVRRKAGGANGLRHRIRTQLFFRGENGMD